MKRPITKDADAICERLDRLIELLEKWAPPAEEPRPWPVACEHEYYVHYTAGTDYPGAQRAYEQCAKCGHRR